MPFGPGSHRVDVVLDHALRFVRVTVEGKDAVLTRDTASEIPAGPFRVDPRVRQLPDAVGLCRDLVGGQSSGAGSSS